MPSTWHRRWEGKGQWLPWARAALGIFVAYVAAAKLGLSLDPVEGFATLVWPPTGIALACLARFGPGLWPAIGAGAFVANLWTGAPGPVAAGIAFGNTLEAVLGAQLLRSAEEEPGRPTRDVRQVAALLVAALVSPLVSATIGVACLWSAGITPSHRAAGAWQAWWLGDLLGALVVAPVLMKWASPSALGWSRGRRIETVGAAAAVCFSALVSFSGGSSTSLQQPHMIFPALIWAALRFGPGGAALSVLVASAIAIALTTSGHGPYAVGALHERLAVLQGFMGNTAVTSLLLAAVSAERFRALQALGDRQRALEQALGIRDEFLSIASHELRTPLTALSLQVSALDGSFSEASAPRTERDRDRVRRATRQVERLSRLVDQLLDVSRLVKGRLALERETFDLAELVHAIVRGLSEAAERAGCAVTVLASSPLVGVWDRFRIEQVLTNLLTNAFKYGAGKPIEVSLQSAGGRAVLSVTDHGVGIPRDALPRIFERFERAAAGHQGRSLGLGLYIARQVVEAHAGTIDVESTPGSGSRFTVDLPLEPQ